LKVGTILSKNEDFSGFFSLTIMIVQYIHMLIMQGAGVRE